MSTPNDKLLDCYLDTFLSLNESLVQAGGTALKFAQFKEWKLDDFLYYIAPNGIRFTFNKEKTLK